MKKLSLSDFIKLPDVKAKLRQEVEKPRFSEDKPLLAPVLTSDPQKIGIAFHYLMRFYAKYLNPNAAACSTWVAEKSLKLLEKYKDDDAILITPNFRLTKVPNTVEIPAGFVKNCKEQKNKWYLKAKITIKTAKENFRSYLITGKMSDKLIASALELAKLDVLSITPKRLSILDKNDMNDLRQLVRIANPDVFKADYTCVLNPSFGPEAAKLMDAEGDLVIDDTLIDIKTVKPLKVDRKIFNQLLGYYTLYRIGGIRGMSPDNQITKLGVYFSRHGYLHIYKVEEIINESTYPDFIEWFKKRALNSGLP